MDKVSNVERDAYIYTGDPQDREGKVEQRLFNDSYARENANGITTTAAPQEGDPKALHNAIVDIERTFNITAKQLRADLGLPEGASDRDTLAKFQKTKQQLEREISMSFGPIVDAVGNALLTDQHRADGEGAHSGNDTRARNLSEMQSANGGYLDRALQVELDTRLRIEKPEMAELARQDILQTLNRDDKARLAGYEEFNAPWQTKAAELVAQEIRGTIDREGRAELAAWREYNDEEQDNRRSLVRLEFLGQLDKEGAAELQGLREFPADRLKYSARGRSLVKDEMLGQLKPGEAEELAKLREQPRIPVYGNVEILINDDRPRSFNESQNRKDRTQAIAKNEFPENEHGRELVVKYMNAALSRQEAAELGGLREFPTNAGAAELARAERLGSITPAQKAQLLAWREFPANDHESAQGRRLVERQITESLIDPVDQAKLVALREFKQSNPFGPSVDVPPHAMELAEKDYLKTISPTETKELARIRREYTALVEKARMPQMPDPPDLPNSPSAK